MDIQPTKKITRRNPHHYCIYFQSKTSSRKNNMRNEQYSFTWEQANWLRCQKIIPIHNEKSEVSFFV